MQGKPCAVQELKENIQRGIACISREEISCLATSIF
jgi:hypothetical protein